MGVEPRRHGDCVLRVLARFPLVFIATATLRYVNARLLTENRGPNCNSSARPPWNKDKTVGQKTPFKLDTREVCLLDSRSGVLGHRTHARVCACHRSMTPAFIIRDAICAAFGAVRKGITLQMSSIWGPRSCDAQKGPQKSPLRESLSGNPQRMSMDNPIALLTAIFRNL